MTAFPDYKFIFVLTPFAPEHEEIYKTYIKRPLESKGYKVEKADTIIGALREDILQRINRQIHRAGIIVVNTTGANPNVMFEYGIAYSMQKEIIPVCEDAKALPVDIRHLVHIEYKNAKEKFSHRLIDEITAIEKRRQDTGEQQFEEFWNTCFGDITDKEDILVVLSAKGRGKEHADLSESLKPGHTEKLSYNEVAAFQHLQNSLSSIRHYLKVIHGNLSNLDYREDGKLILIGSPHASGICDMIISECKSPKFPYQFKTSKRGAERHKYIETKDGRFPPDRKSKEAAIPQENLKEDYGIILRITNPLSDLANNKVLILAGNHGYGTESAVRMVSDCKQVKFLHEKVGKNDFVSLFKVHVGARTGLSPNFLQMTVLNEGKWEIVYDKIDRR